ncbi:MAG: hypothetical protein IPM59_00905 [Chloracidobacterium sp.]|nr:hypothetical protein [Chloracidobacterium sp.]
MDGKENSSFRLASIPLVIVLQALVLLIAQSADAQPIRSNAGVYEGEALVRSGKAIARGGNVTAQPMSDFGQGWSGNAQLFWGGGEPGAVLDLNLDVATAGRYTVELELTRAPDYGQLQFEVDGRRAGGVFNGFAPNVVHSGPINIGGFDLRSGAHKLSVKITGKDRSSSGYLVGIDRVRLMMTEAVSPAREPTRVASPPRTIIPALISLRPTLQIWNGIFTVDGAPLVYVKDAVYGPSTTKWLWSFRWSANVPGAHSAVLVASSQEPSSNDAPLSPPGIVGIKPVPDSVPPSGETRDFKVDISSWFPTGRGLLASPRLYIRIVLLDAAGQPVGSPSATVTLARGGRDGNIDVAAVFASAARIKAETEAMRAKASVFEVKLLKHRPVIFPDPNRWGCIVVVKNPYYQKFTHPLAPYQPGRSYCPPIDPSTQEKTTWGWIETGVTGWVKAYDGLAHFYDEAKSYLATQFANTVPCHWLGKKAKDDCKDAAKQLAGTAISVGLAAAGVPPSLPDTAALQEMGKGKVVDAAVEFSCDSFESQGGACTPEMRAQLAKWYKQGLDKILAEIQKDGKEPDCGDAQTAKEHGRLPLPCFTAYPGTDIKPATGSVYEPSYIIVRVRRVKPDPDFALPTCSVYAVVNLQNNFKGGWFGGWKAKPGLLSGEAFVQVRHPIPELKLGKSIDLTLTFTKIQKHSLPGLNQPDYIGWMHLYQGGNGFVMAGTETNRGILLPDSPNVPRVIGCGGGDKWDVQIPSN